MKGFFLGGPQRDPEGPQCAWEGPQRRSDSPKKKTNYPPYPTCLFVHYFHVIIKMSWFLD